MIISCSVPHQITNICILHLSKRLQIGDGFLKKFLEDTKSMTPEERGNALADNLGFMDSHQEIAVEGQSEVYLEIQLISEQAEVYSLDCTNALDAG